MKVVLSKISYSHVEGKKTHAQKSNAFSANKVNKDTLNRRAVVGLG